MDKKEKSNYGPGPFLKDWKIILEGHHSSQKKFYDKKHNFHSGYSEDTAENKVAINRHKYII